MTISCSKIWYECKIFNLTKNMHVCSYAQSNSLSQVDCIEWLLSIGDGKVPHFSICNSFKDSWIELPEDLLVNAEGGMNALIDEIYTDYLAIHTSVAYLRSRAILAPRNDEVGALDNC